MNSEGAIKVKWLPNNAQELDITPLELFIPKAYVLEGVHDLGFIEIYVPNEFVSRKDLLDCNDDTSVIGKVSVGYGNFLINGKVLSVNHDRVLMQAPSEPGCSGSPLFNNNKKLVALVHGVSKHRGQSTYSNGIHDEISSILYADVVHIGMEFFCVPSSFYKELNDAENIPLEIAKYPNKMIGEFEDVKIHCERLLKPENAGKTLNDVMREFANEIWSNEQTSTENHLILIEDWNIISLDN
jgi:hypothetical protein